MDEELPGDLLVPLSPSRVADFKTCPQLFKFRAIDRLPEAADIYSARGTLVHSVLESVFALAAEERTLERCKSTLRDLWQTVRQEEEMQGLELSEEQEAIWLAEAEQLLINYFKIEDPATISPHELEWWVEHAVDKALLRGIIDRVEVTEDDEWILTDYKTGRSPSDNRALGSFFGLKFYALVCWREFGHMPKALRLIHLREPEVITLVPTEQMLRGLERQLLAVAGAITRAHEKDDWRPRQSYMCNFCSHRSICPAFADEVELAAVVGA